jgi:Protein of unknown function (DUF3175)
MAVETSGRRKTGRPHTSPARKRHDRLGRSSGKKWSQHVTRTSNALDLEAGIFTLRSSRAVAASLKRSALRSRRRKGAPYQSAASMLNFYINRAGKGLSPSRRRVLERAKGELRKAFGRAPASRRPR